MIRRARHQPIRRENYARARAKRPWLIPIGITPTGAMVKHERRYDGLRTEELEDFYMSTKKWLRWPTGCSAATALGCHSGNAAAHGSTSYEGGEQ